MDDFLKKKTVSIDGVMADILREQSIPKMVKIKQIFKKNHVKDVVAITRKELKKRGTLDKIKPDQSIAITAGSRGIANIALIIKTIVNEVKAVGGKPFIIPAMGSHGGATSRGQKDILAGYGITEEYMGCPIRASMETVQIDNASNGLPVFIDKHASQSDGIIVVNRIKAHTAFRGDYESGLVKMITIGLGKQKGAGICHSRGFGEMANNIKQIAKKTLASGKILFGVGIIENAYEKTARISAIPAKEILKKEIDLLNESKRMMPEILIKNIDVLIIDEIGKDISGDGMDPNITGTFATPYASGGSNQQRTVVLDLTDETHGNALGLGMADFSVPRAFHKMNFEVTYPNCLTCKVTEVGKIPMIMGSDKMAIQAAILTCKNIDFANPRIIRIKNTLHINEILISKSIIPEAEKHSQIKLISEPQFMQFNNKGNLFK